MVIEIKVRMPMWLALLILLFVVVGDRATAQVTFLPTPAPVVTGERAPWLANGEPVFYEGDLYYPRGADVFFDGLVMARTGVYKGIPLYEDRTFEPYSVVYVPIGGNLMRPYERRRAGELAGTTGSRTPSFPVAMPGAIWPTAEMPSAVGTTGTVIPSPSSPSTLPQEPVGIETIPPPSTTRGIWVDFQGAHWYSAGRAVTFDSDRFVQAGASDDHAVYRLKSGRSDEIYVMVSPGGPVAPYRR